ncbi:MAG: alkaline phosphatase family protein [Planctomycetota bacterium]|jgi:predicted AlkP superfamily phosphohydrolase/phosphomutase
MASLPGKVVVIGLDGADPAVLGPWMDAGDLPSLAALRDRGAMMPLRSTVPPVSAPAWATFMTGRGPGGHGVFGFVDEDGEGGTRLANLASVRGTKLWEVPSREGRRVAVLNVPVTFPVPEVNWLFVSGMLTPPGRPFTRPGDYEDRIREIAPAYRTDIDRRLLTDKEALLAHLYEQIDARAEVFADALAREAWDLFVCVFTETDRIQHHFWRDRMEDIRRFFIRLDGHIGRIADAAPPDALVMVLSDHGFTGTHSRFYANAWLNRAGYQKLRRTAGDVDDYESRRFNLFMGEDAKIDARRGIGDRLAALFGRGGRRSIDWNRTRAYLYSSSSHGIEVNLRGRQPEGIVSEEDYEPLRQELKERLAALIDPHTGETVFSEVLLREEAYRGPYLARAPDIILVPRDGRYRIVTRVDAKRPFRRHRLPEGYHGDTGLLIVAGPGVAVGAAGGPGIADVMPTALWALDLPVPARVEGAPLLEAFEPDAVGARPVRTSEEPEDDAAEAGPELSDEEEDALRDTLRGLGYL